MGRIRLAVLYGGRSGEHEVSLRSARSVIEALDRDKYELVLIGIDPEGHWHRHTEEQFRRLTSATASRIEGSGDAVTLPPAPRNGHLLRLDQQLAPVGQIDVAFPVLHGPLGEDGTVQGLFELADVPYVGAGVLGSALGMDKDVQKRLLRAAGIPTVDWVVARQHEWDADRARVRAAASRLSMPVFVKPANLGSSVGVTKVTAPAGLDAAIAAAFAFDTKVLVEQGIDAREIECAVLGNEYPEVSVLGEVCPTEEFYSYEAKYVNEHGATFIIPAPLPPERTQHIQALAIEAFRTIECEGMARVDFFLDRQTDGLYVNELNTIPGFTSISQYPKLWEASGVPYRQLLDRLIALALERHQRRRRLRTSYGTAT